MTYDLTTQNQIIEALTGKTIETCTPVILTSIDLANKQKEENWNGNVFYGTLAICSDAKVDFVIEGANGNMTSLPVNKLIQNTEFKVYDNLIFDKIIAGEEYRLNSETEAMFAGYLYTFSIEE